MEEGARSLRPEEIRRLADLGLEPEQQFRPRTGDKNSEKEVQPIHHNNEEVTMEPGQAQAQATRTPSTGNHADTVDQATLQTNEAVHRLLASFEQQTSFKADAYHTALIAVGVAAGVTAGGLVVYWITKPGEPEVASMPAKK